MEIRKILLTILVPILLLVWVWFSRVPTSATRSSSIEAPKKGFLAPSFNLPSLNGDSVSLVELRGKPVILNFWASWCPPCRAEMPDFQQARIEYADTDLEIIAINATHQDSLADVERFVQQNMLEFPILLDSGGNASHSYQIHSLPTTFIIDREGVIIKTLIGGPVPLSLLRIEANQLLEGISDVTNH